MFTRRIRTFALTLLVPLLGLAVVLPGCKQTNGEALKPNRAGYLFCLWNVENLFDDKDDHRRNAGDKDYDPWFANDPDILKLKLSNLSKALIKLNGGKGPDILAVVEVESVRAAELLRDALNNRLADESLHYKNVLMKNLSAGRHIAPAIITRLPVIKDKTQLHGNRQRILEGHIKVDGKELIIVASHWTSRLRQGSDKHRDNYGDKIYGLFRALYKRNPAVDLLVCGDFNDNPDDDSVTRHLHALGDRDAVLAAGDEPLLLNLFAGKDRKEYGTHYDRGRWSIFDQIAISPGLLDDRGWTCDINSVTTVNSLVRPRDRLKRPWRFGSKRDKGERGYSDHFPVTVRLRVNTR
jgi:endonuclease/exonuclease/phosphatase family metal-dependent hydrolase